MKTLNENFGYWDTTNNPIGCSFRRAPKGGLKIVKVIRSIGGNYKGVNEEGITEEGRKIAYDSDNCK
jgi:hypothetical protein